jgi:hypothetical protein
VEYDIFDSTSVSYSGELIVARNTENDIYYDTMETAGAGTFTFKVASEILDNGGNAIVSYESSNFDVIVTSHNYQCSFDTA